jgi:hypothetical protein
MQKRTTHASTIVSGATFALLLVLAVACLPPEIGNVLSSVDTPGAAPSPISARVTLRPATSTISAGEVSSLEVYVENAIHLQGAEVHLAFDPNTLEVVDADSTEDGTQIAVGTLLAADFVAVNQADNEAGTIDFAIVQIESEAATADGVLAIIQFRGKAAGTSAIAFRSLESAPAGVLLADTSARSLATTTEEASVTVN